MEYDDMLTKLRADEQEARSEIEIAAKMKARAQMRLAKLRAAIRDTMKLMDESEQPPDQRIGPISENEIEELREMYEGMGMSIEAIHRQTGRARSALRKHRDRGGWKKRAGFKDQINVRCPGCGYHIHVAPCPVCKHNSDALVIALKDLQKARSPDRRAHG